MTVEIRVANNADKEEECDAGKCGGSGQRGAGTAIGWGGGSRTKIKIRITSQVVTVGEEGR